MKQFFQLIGKSRGLQTLMVISFLITGIIVAYAVHTNQSNEQALESALEDKIRFASWIYNTTAEESLKQSAYQTLKAVLGSVEKNKNGQLSIDLDPEVYNQKQKRSNNSECNRNFLKPVQGVFVYDLNTGQIANKTANGKTGDQFNSWLKKEVKELSSSASRLYKKLYKDETEHEYLVIMAQSPGLSPLNRKLIIGAKVRVENLELLFKEIWKNKKILPESVGGDQTAEEMMAVEINSENGARIFSSGDPSDKTISVKAGFNNESDVFTGKMAISSPKGSNLMSAGIHGASNMILIILFVLASGLGIIAFLQFKNESKLIRMKRDFVSNVSHELRTPVTQIRMFAETLLNGRTRSNKEVKKSLQIIEKESERLSHLISNILDFTAKEHQVLKTSPEIIQVDQEIKQAVQAFKPIADSASNQIELDVEPLTAWLDPSGFKQILINVLDNAVKYGPEGQQIDIRLIKHENNFTLSIIDEGPGIPEEIQNKVWESHWRQDDSGHSKTGIGIGLSVVKQYLEQLKGSVEIRNNEDKGAEFKFRFPIEQKGDHDGTGGKEEK